ncbi:MAG TPA: hypothetical protein VMI09_11325 [Candidatus Binataceae bacterium]|nr:hypothetical protein [Candidatus Binataceae bacterium]
MTDLQRRLDRWRRDPVAFMAEALINPETGKPFTLYPAQVVAAWRRAQWLGAQSGSSRRIIEKWKR